MPNNRSNEARIRANLERHQKIMDKLIIQGWGRIEAAAEALRIMETNKANDELRERMEKAGGYEER